MIRNESVISQLAIVLVVARLLLLSSLALALPFWNTAAGGDGGADCGGFLAYLLTALASGFLELLQLSLAVGAQSGQAGLFGVAAGLEVSSLFGVGGGVSGEQGAFAVADGLFVGAAFQGLVFSLVVGTPVVPVTTMGLAILRRQGDAGLFQAGFELALQGILQGLSAFAAGAATAAFAAGATTGTATSTTAGTTAGTTGAAFALLARWRRGTAVAGVAGIELRFQGLEFGLEVGRVFLVTVLHARAEVLELS